MDMLMNDWMGKPLWAWVGFMVVVLTLLVLDLFVLNRKAHVVTMKESLLTTAGYATLATIFGIWLGMSFGGEKAMQYFTGYVVEMSLSMDNVFVMALILGYFHIPLNQQHRVLFWGVIGVVVLRGVTV